MVSSRVEMVIDRVVEFAMRPRIRRVRRWSFVVTLPLGGLLIWWRGLQEAAIVPLAYAVVLIGILLGARRIGGLRGELLLDFVMHPVGRRAFRTELHLMATLARAVRRAVGRGDRTGEYSYHGRSSDLAVALAFLPAVAAEIAIVELLLSGVALWIRLVIAALSLYGLAWLIAWTVGLRVYPHRLLDGALETRLGAFYRAVVPLDAITAVDIVSRRHGTRTELLLTDGAAALAVGAKTNLRLRLARPVTVLRPLGDPVEVSQLELAADDPAGLAQAIRERLDRNEERTHDDHPDRTLVCGHD